MIVKPGDILAEELEARGWTQGEFAEIIGRPIQAVNEILKGKKSITPDTAIEIAQALGTSPELWLNLESSYRLHLAAKKEPDDTIAKRARIYSFAPVNYLFRIGAIAKTKDADKLEREVLEYYGVKKLEDIPKKAASSRMAAHGK